MIRPKRVLVTTDAVGGVWRYSVDLVHGLDRSGIACLLVGAGPAPDDARVHECNGWRWSEIVWTEHGLDWMTDDPDAFNAARGELEERARAWDADIVHLHLPSQAAGMSGDLTIVAVSHSCRATWWDAVAQGSMPGDWLANVERTRDGLTRVDQVIVPTESHAKALRRVYGPIDGIAVIPNAIVPAEDTADKEPFVLAAGRWWDTGKNGGRLDLAARDITWPVLIAGPLSGPDGSACAIEHAAALGEMTNTALRHLMERAAIFVSPSLYEPFGLAVLEAASHGCVLVLADIPAFRELWNGAAIFADPRDAGAFARAVETVCRDDRTRADLASAAKRAAGRFTPERHLRSVLDVYEQCLAVNA